MKRFRILNLGSGTKRIAGLSVKVVKSINGKSGIIEVSDQEANLIMESESYKRGNVIPFTEEDAKSLLTISNAKDQIENMGILFTPEEVESFVTLPEEAIAKIKEFAFEVRNFYKNSGDTGKKESGKDSGDESGEGIELPAYEDVTASQIKEILSELEVEYGDNESKKDLYEKLEKQFGGE